MHYCIESTQVFHETTTCDFDQKQIDQRNQDGYGRMPK